MTAKKWECPSTPGLREDQQYVTEKLSLLAGLQATYIQRHFKDYFDKLPAASIRQFSFFGR